MSAPVIYEGSVKNLLGPVDISGSKAVIFDYTDAFSVFDWGRMPDALPKKGEALALLAADWFEKLEKPVSWVEFSKSPQALGLRKSNRFGAAFIELGEMLQQEGLKTHYLGALNEGEDRARPLSDIRAPIKKIAVKQVSAVRPTSSQVMGRNVSDYSKTRMSAAPRLVPLEVVFRFSCPAGSSILERVAKDPHYLASIGFGDSKIAAGEKWDFPILELFTKLETSDRPVSLSEGLAISGISGPQLQEVLFKTAWIAGYLRYVCARAGLELADGKLEWAVSQHGEVFLADAIGPDELRLLGDGVQLSKEFLRNFYRATPWFESITKAKEIARSQGSADWKRNVTVSAPALSSQYKEAASQLYMALTNQLTERTWFPQAWDMKKVISEIKKL